MSEQIENHNCNKEKELTRLTIMIEEIHKELMGNGRAGMIEKWHKLEGQFSVWKFIASSGLIVSMFNFFVRFFK